MRERTITTVAAVFVAACVLSIALAVIDAIRHSQQNRERWFEGTGHV